FREDLYYRVSEITLHVPPLRERSGDALVIAQSLLKTFTKQMDRGIVGFSDDAIRAIQQYEWPGNVRELINKIKRATIMSENQIFDVKDLDLQVIVDSCVHVLYIRLVREATERQAIIRVLQTVKYNMAQDSRLLGVTRPTLYNLTDKYNLQTP